MHALLLSLRGIRSWCDLKNRVRRAPQTRVDHDLKLKHQNRNGRYERIHAVIHFHLDAPKILFLPIANSDA
jgi:hypothetical protein